MGEIKLSKKIKILSKNNLNGPVQIGESREDLCAPPLPGLQGDLPHVLLGLFEELFERP